MGSPECHPLPRRTVLVIDDDAAIRELVEQVLTRHGFAVLQAADGAQGLEVYEAHDVDMVLLDLSMPGLPGEAVLQLLLERHPDARVVLFTGFADDDTPFLGARAILHKPFPLDELVERVREVLGEQEQG